MGNLGRKDIKNEEKATFDMIIRREFSRSDERHTSSDSSTVSSKQNKVKDRYRYRPRHSILRRNYRRPKTKRRS